jgi:hypothetical protein
MILWLHFLPELKGSAVILHNTVSSVATHDVQRNEWLFANCRQGTKIYLSKITRTGPQNPPLLDKRAGGDVTNPVHKIFCHCTESVRGSPPHCSQPTFNECIINPLPFERSWSFLFIYLLEIFMPSYFRTRVRGQFSKLASIIHILYYVLYYDPIFRRSFNRKLPDADGRRVDIVLIIIN